MGIGLYFGYFLFFIHSTLMITDSQGTFFTMSLLFQWKGLLFSPQPRNKNATASAGVEHIVYNNSGAI